MDRDQRVLPVVRPGQHKLEFEVAQLRRNRRDLGLSLGQRVDVVGLLGQLQQQLGLVDALVQLNPRCKVLAETGELLLDRLGALGIVPEAGLRRLLLELRELLLLCSEVKDAPGGPRRAGAGRSVSFGFLARVSSPPLDFFGMV